MRFFRGFINIFLLILNLSHLFHYLNGNEFGMDTFSFGVIGDFLFLTLLLFFSILVLVGFGMLKIIEVTDEKKISFYLQKQVKRLFGFIGVFYLILAIILPFFEKFKYFVPHNLEYSLFLVISGLFIIHHYRKI